MPRKCIFDGCDKHPSYDDVGALVARFCKSHAHAGMVDIKHKRCIFDGCDTRPNYDDVGALVARFCKSHAHAGMVDIKSKRCIFDGCDTRPNYGKPGLPTSMCSTHKEKGMIRKSNAKCGRCKKMAIWGKNWIPLSCEDHKQDDDMNLVERRCVLCQLTCVLDATDRCEYCNPESWRIARLVKQNALMSYLDQRDLFGTSTDVTVDGGACGLERPDRVYDFGDKIVILECDEDQHKSRPCLCEQTRMVNLGQAFGGMPVYFIRWNPDNYEPRDARKMPEIVIRRYELVGNYLRDIRDGRVHMPQSLTSVIHLYFDGWAGLGKAEWSILC